MYNWRLRWNFNRESYKPDSIGQISFNMENYGEEPIFVSDVGIKFDWMKDMFYHIKLDENEGKLVRSKKTKFISNINFTIPENVSGQRFYKVCIHGYKFNRQKNIWEDLGKIFSKKAYINIFAKPYYKAFITRSLATEDRIIGDEIVGIIKEWGFITKTVEFEEHISEKILREAIRNEILNSDCLLAIATPRYVDALKNVWRTFPWLHSEVGIAFGNDFPIMILVDKRVDLDGLPSILKDYALHFDIDNYEKIREVISEIMPIFRNCLSDKKWEAFKDKLKKVGIGVSILTLGGITGYLVGTTKKEELN